MLLVSLSSASPSIPRAQEFPLVTTLLLIPVVTLDTGRTRLILFIYYIYYRKSTQQHLHPSLPPFPKATHVMNFGKLLVLDKIVLMPNLAGLICSSSCAFCSGQRQYRMLMVVCSGLILRHY